MAMAISKGLSFLCLVAIFISLLFIKVADAESHHFGIHAVGHAIEPFCPGGYSDRGDHCQNIGRIISHNQVESDDFDDTYKFTGKASMALSTSESTEAAEERAVDLEMENVFPDEPIAQKIIVLGH